MITHELLQGSQAWLSYRKNYFNASDAPAMIGCSPYKTRTELLHEISTGMTPAISEFTQNIFNDGHRFEGLARSIAEEIVGEDLYQVTGSLDKYSASFDGLTLCGTTIFEHKTLNDTLRKAIIDNELPLMYRIQMEQQLLVSKAGKCLFMASKWNADAVLIEELHCWYMPDGALQNQIIDGWRQFQIDLDNYVPPVIVETPKAEAIIDLPAVIVQVTGSLTACNITDMRPIFDKFLSEALVTLVTDSDFAQAEAESKIGRDAAKRCLATAKGVIDQTASISEVTRELELYAAKFNALALSQEKAVKTQKESRKLAIMSLAKSAFAEHIAELELEINPVRLITGQPNFAEAMKNKRLLAAIQDAVDSELARVKIDADGVARLIRFNLNLMSENKAHKFLFNDLDQIVYKSFDDLKLLVESRIAAHEKAEIEKSEALILFIEAEAKRKAEHDQAEKLFVERAKIREEEQAKIAEERRLERIEFAIRLEAAKIDELEKLAREDSDRIALEKALPTVIDAKKSKSPEPQLEPYRPTDDEILELIMVKFVVDAETALDWIDEFDTEFMRINMEND